MKRKSIFLCIFILVSTWFTSSYAASCSVDNWCLMSSGMTEYLWGIWGTDGKSVFAVGTDTSGENRPILHYDGNKWTKMESVGVDHLGGVWGSSVKDVFACGIGGIILHYDGNEWSQVFSVEIQMMLGIWGSSSNDVFAVGDEATILHYDGVSWSIMNNDPEAMTTFYDVWGSSGSDVYAVTSNGGVWHYDGLSWSVVSSGTVVSLSGVWGSSGSDVFAVGASAEYGEWGWEGPEFGVILHYDGEKWSEITPDGMEPLRDVWGSSANDVYAVESSGGIWHYDGITWSPMKSGTTKILNAIWGSSPNDIFVVGYDGTILRRHLPGPYKLSVSLSGNGAVTSVPTGIHCPGDCTELYAENTSVTLSVVPAKGAVFGSWSDNSCRGTGPCTVIMDRDRQVGANFGKKGSVPWSMLLLKNQQ